MVTHLASARRAVRPLALLVAVLLAAAVSAGTLLAGPALATEAEAPAEATEAPAEGEGTAAEEAEEGGKLTISDNPHDQFGLVLIGLAGLAGLAALGNAARQLAGKRPQADGRIRWR